MSKRSLLRGRVADKKRLGQIAPTQQGLGMRTIMDRTLAEAHGADYVHLAVFSIDLDRCFQLDPDDTRQPFGWEVFLTACYVVGAIETHAAGGRELLESACMSVLDGDPAEAPLGGQLAFAVHDALQRGRVDPALKSVFRSWRGGRRQLQRSLDPLWADAEANIQRMALHCLSLPMEPPCAPPTLETLERMARGQFVLPAPPDPAVEGGADGD